MNLRPAVSLGTVCGVALSNAGRAMADLPMIDASKIPEEIKEAMALAFARLAVKAIRRAESERLDAAPRETAAETKSAKRKARRN